MPTCPNCNCTFTVKKAAKKPELIERVIDGKTYYGKIINYSTGARMSFFTFPIKDKKRKPFVPYNKNPVDWLNPKVFERYKQETEVLYR
jgi:hypothetical protein